jgi:hypothetical protein
MSVHVHIRLIPLHLVLHDLHLLVLLQLRDLLRRSGGQS